MALQGGPALAIDILAMRTLPYGCQTIDEDDLRAVADALRGQRLTCGPLVARFEEAVARRVAAPFASACSSGTAALHLAYAAFGFGDGDEIITSPITFSATASAAYYVGARVLFADVDPRTGNLDPASVEALIGRRTRAIVPVHLAGMPADLDELTAIARRHGLRIIEDACHALGATYHNVPIGGGTSDAVVFSFHPVKHITTGEGGAVIVRDPKIKQRIDRLRHHGIEREPSRLLGVAEGEWTYEVQELGWNYRLPDVACALGLSQLSKLDVFVNSRRELAAYYRQRLAETFGSDGVEAPVELPDRTSAYHLFAVAIDFARFGTTRRDVMARLSAAGIGTQVHYIPLLAHPLHAARSREAARARPGVDHYYARTLSLPLYPSLTNGDVDRVVSELARCLRGIS